MSNRYYYLSLGDKCKSQSGAITSNEKFLPPLDSIYFKNYTKNVLLYPGHEKENVMNKSVKPQLLANVDKKQCRTCSS